jgi:hypothetical protein
MKAGEEKLGQKKEAVPCWTAERKDECMGTRGEGDVSVCQPECFDFKCAQVYLNKGLSSFSGRRAGRRRWEQEAAC